jgi:hypothetical protein
MRLLFLHEFFLYAEPFPSSARTTHRRRHLLDDRELGKKISAGDSQAFDGWYRETAPRLRAFLRHLLVNPQAAEDVMLSRISFDDGAHSYAFFTGAPVTREDHLWVLREAKFKPSESTGGAFIGSVDLDKLPSE